MILAVVATLLILGIAAFQAYQGMFSALITLFLTMLCLVIAFNWYEPMAGALHGTQPAYADAISLLALFVLPLIVLRNLADWLIRGNVATGADLTGVWIDRAIAGVFGLLTGILLVGVLTIATQLLPWGRSALGYTPFSPSLQRTGALWPFCPDQLTLGIARGLSGGSLSGEQAYGQVHDNLLLEAYCRRNMAEMNGRTEAPPDSLDVDGAVDITTRMDAYIAEAADIAKRAEEDEQTPPDPILIGQDPQQGVPHGLFDPERHPVLAELEDGAYVVVFAAVDKSARGPTEANYWRLVGTHFRLVGQSGRSYYPVAGEAVGMTDASGDTILGYFPLRDEEDAARKMPVEPYLMRAKIEEAEAIKEQRGRFDLSRLAVLARLPSEPKRGQDPGPDIDSVQNVRVAWLYVIDTDDKPNYMVFRGIAKDAVPEVQEME